MKTETMKMLSAILCAALTMAGEAAKDKEKTWPVQPKADKWYVCGGTEKFRAFLKTLADGASFETFAAPETMPFADATNSVFFILPDYAHGKRTVPEMKPDAAKLAKAAIGRGNRFWAECYVSTVGHGSREKNLFATETYGTKPIAFNQEYVEWAGEVLQARRSHYLPAGLRDNRKGEYARSHAAVSDCIGVHGVHKPGDHRLPAMVVTCKGAVVATLVDFTQFDAKFMRPYRTWREFFAKEFGRFTGAGEAKSRAAFDATWPDFISVSGKTDASAALLRALEWHFKSGVVRKPGDGSAGMHEAIVSDTFGYRTGLRTDCHLITGSLFAHAGKKFNKPEWTQTGKNLVDFILAKGAQSPEGFFTWFAPGEGRAGDTVYSSDMGRSALAMVNMWKATGERKYLDCARRAADAFLMWMDGRKLNSGWFPDLSKGGWKNRGTDNNPVFYGEMVSFLLQMDEQKYRDAAIATLDKISEVFPDVAPFHFSDNFTYSRYLVMLACAQRSSGRDYSERINRMLDFFAKYIHPRAGGIVELPIRLVDNDEAGVGIGDGTDNIADLLYCNNFVFNATSVLMKLPGERQKGVDMEKVRKVYSSVRRFLLESQIVSKDPRFDGAWMRAFDMDLGEYYGLNKDTGWGAYCIETGWVTGYIPAVLLFEDGEESYFFR